MEAKLLPLSLHLCISILSHPLYLSYFIFFFPYILTLFSFLFPLFIATSLLLLALYTLSPPLPQDYYDFSHFSESKVGVFSAFQPFLEDFEARKGENGEDPDGCGEGKDEETAEFYLAKSFPPLTQNFQENKEPESTHISEFKKNEEEEEEEEKKTQVTEENPAEAEENPNSGPSFSRTKSMEDSQALGLNINGSPGSMGKEREWRRTLACKLYEERSSMEGGSERMDLLWETYEQESSRVERNRRSSSRKCKNGGFKHEKKEKENEEDDYGELCCLQAFKISAGKMNLGMGKGNLVKFSKALKGIGWFHQVKTKHLRKRL